MDLEDQELAVLEERLYSSIHHSYEESANIPDATTVPSAPSRIVSRTTVVNNSQGILPANMKRYWAGSTVPNTGERAPYAKNNPTDAAAVKDPVSGANAAETVRDGGIVQIKKVFLTPYQSLLGNNDGKVSENQSPLPENASPNQILPERATRPIQAAKEPGLQLKKKKQTKQSGQFVQKRLASLLRLIDKDRKENAMEVLESKKTKANRVRQRKRAPVIVAEICINSSDEESQPVKQQIKSTSPIQMSDDEADEVIIIPTPPPLQICIDCSDEEEPNSSQFALPKSKNSKKQKQTPATSSRCHSPSNSSIMSDDFIGQHDRSRLNDSFNESIPSDDELVCALEGNRRAGMSGKATKPAVEIQQERVPSISSEDTISTNGDTTDQEKRPHEPGKESAAKSQPSVNGAGPATNAKSKKETTATKTVPSRGKNLSKSAPASPVTESAASPSTTSKGNVNNKPNSGAIASDISNIAKKPTKSKPRSKSPVSLVMELVRKQFEAKKARDDSGKKAKSKKDGSAARETGSGAAKSGKETTVPPSTDKPKECVEKDNAVKAGKAATKSRSKNVSLLDENVSSESDYELLHKNASSTSTPQESDKRSRRSASTFIEQAVDVSSESDYDDSFLQAKKPPAPPEKQAAVEKEPKKRIGRKRKQYNSETYSDEDFACLLTDIVRAVSDTEEEDDEEDDDDENNASAAKAVSPAPVLEATAAAIPVNNEAASEEHSTPSREDLQMKKKRKLKDVPPVTAEGKEATKQPSNPIELEEQPQPETGVKKKKKAKDKKTSVKDATTGSGCSTPEAKTVVSQSPVVKRKKKQTNAANVPPNNVQVTVESDDEDIQIVVNAPPRHGTRKPKTLGPDCAWNEEMKQFYNTSWAGENMDLEMVLRKMPYDNKQWQIVHKDRFPEPPKKEITCTNCGERGHLKFRCRSAPKQSICFMCGEKGHKEPRCPKTICLNCGAKTRSFVRGCKSCSRDADVMCFLCGVRGHTQRTCPDLWRRYHSTTEDNVPLREDYEKNPTVKWCSICCRAGHQAHTCNDARRIFGYPMPNVIVSSYMPAYRGEYNRYRKHQNDEQEKRFMENPTARYNLFSTDASACEFNLSELAQNEKGFYFSFLKSTGLLEKHERSAREQQQARMQQEREMLVQSPEPEEAPIIESTAPQSPEPHVEEEAQPAQQTMEESAGFAEPVKQGHAISDMPVCDDVPALEENSNYSFSEFHTDTVTEMLNFSDNAHHQNTEDGETQPPADNLVPTESNIDQQQWLSDYIPLTVVDPVAGAAPSPEPPQMPLAGPPVPTAPEPNFHPASGSDPSMIAPAVTENGKVMLTKEHASFLLSDSGTEFIAMAGKKHNVQLSIAFEAVGNVLLITGTSAAQTTFHEELVHYLRESEHCARNAKYLQNIVPKNYNKMSRYIACYLRGLVPEKVSMRQLLTQLNHSTNPDTQAKYRRRLNTYLFGVYGLRDGRKHLNVLRNQLALCMNANPWKGELEEYQRIIINDAIRYIFSGYDHKNYDAVVEEFELLRRMNKLQMLTYYDLGIPRFIPRPQTAEVPMPKKKIKAKKDTTGGGKPKFAVKPNRSKNHPSEVAHKRPKDRFVAGSTGSATADDDFIMNTTADFPALDPMRLSQLDHLTRHVYQHPQEREYEAYEHKSQYGPSSVRSANRNYPSSNRSDRYQWGWDGQQQSIADRSNALREQEWSQLQRLQDILRR